MLQLKKQKLLDWTIKQTPIILTSTKVYISKGSTYWLRGSNNYKGVWLNSRVSKYIYKKQLIELKREKKSTIIAGDFPH